MQLYTPSGKPLSCMISENAAALAGTISEGFNTTVFPNAIAGAIFHAATAIGKFHGVITPTTPRGSLVTSIFILGLTDAAVSPICLRTSAAKY